MQMYDRFEGFPVVFCFLPCLGDSVIYPQTLTLPKFNGSPLKNDGKGRRSSPFRSRYIFQGRTVKLPGGKPKMVFFWCRTCHLHITSMIAARYWFHRGHRHAMPSIRYRHQEDAHTGGSGFGFREAWRW